MQIPLALEVRRLVQTVERLDQQILVLGQESSDGVPAPDVELALLAFAVGVLGGVVAALGMLHFADHPVRRLPHSTREQGIRAETQGVGIQGEQRTVVVEHLLEVGNGPVPVRCVAAESPAEVVVDAAARHLGERRHDHVQRFPVRWLVQVGMHMGPVPEQPFDGRRHGELGGRAEPALRCVVAGLELPACLGQQAPVVRLGLALRDFEVGERVGQPLALLLDLGPLRRVGVADAHQQVGEPGQPVAGTAREIGAGEERQQRRRVEKDGERPTARLVRQQLVAELVDAIEVGSLLAIHLDVHEVLVHHRRRRLVLERLVGHDVAPVTGRVADG